MWLVDVADTASALPFPSLPSSLLSDPYLSLQSHCFSCYGQQNSSNTFFKLTSTVNICLNYMREDPESFLTCRADKSLQSLTEIRDCCHMLLVCQIMSKSRSGPVVNHGCASFPTYTHKHLQTN